MKEIIEKLRNAREATELHLLRSELQRFAKEIAEREKDLDKTKSDLTNETLNRSYAVEFNSQSYASFYNTKIEKDKSILTLSVAGLGFLITFTSLAESLNVYLYSMFLLAAISFMVCIYLIVKIFDENAEYIIQLVTDNPEHEAREVKLRKLDRIAIRSFYLGMLISFCIGASFPLTQSHKENAMADSGDKLSPSMESFEGISKAKKSFTDASKLKPQNSSGGTGTQTTSTTTNSQGGKK